MTDAPAAQSRLVAGPLTFLGVALAALGFRRRSHLLVLAGGWAIGRGLKLAPARTSSDDAA